MYKLIFSQIQINSEKKTGISTYTFYPHANSHDNPSLECLSSFGVEKKK